MHELKEVVHAADEARLAAPLAARPVVAPRFVECCAVEVLADGHRRMLCLVFGRCKARRLIGWHPGAALLVVVADGVGTGRAVRKLHALHIRQSLPPGLRVR